MDEPRALKRARPHDFSAVRLLQRIAVLANEADAYPAAIQAALDAVCEYTAWPVGHAYLIESGDRARLVSTDLWHLDHKHRYDTFVEITKTMPIQVGVGLPGRVLRSKKPEWIRDVLMDRNFPRARTGRDIRVRGAFATPILSGRDVVGILEFFSDHPEPQDGILLELVGYVGTQLGRVAERERFAAELLTQVRHTKRIIESAHDAFVTIDEHGAITNWNQAAEEMFGWRYEDVIGQTLATTIIPRRYREAHTNGIARYLTSGESRVVNQRVELSALRRDGTEFPIELAVWPIYENGRTIFSALIHDITERRQRETERVLDAERVQTSEQRLRAAQEMAAFGSWEWDISGNSVHWSDQLYRNFGVEPGEFTPSFEAYIQLVHPDDRQDVASTITSALDQLGSFDFEHRIIRRSDGALRVHHCRGRVIVEDGHATSMAGTSQDITDHRRSEEALREAFDREREMVDRLEQLDTDRTDFVSAVSHELRTPLTSIIGYLQLVLDMGHEITDEHLEMLDIVDRNSQRLLSLIEDLLTKSRIEAGTFTLNVATTDVRMLIEAAVKAMLPSAVDRDVQLDFVIDPELGSIEADGGQVERLLLNLLSNAIKFTNGGSVTVEAKRNGEDIVLSVRDTGIGISEEDLPQLFSPFFRTTVAEKTAPGTGLGLALVKAIVEAHSGSIEVASKIGEGTTVVVRLPVVYTAAATAA